MRENFFYGRSFLDDEDLNPMGFDGCCGWQTCGYTAPQEKGGNT